MFGLPDPKQEADRLLDSVWEVMTGDRDRLPIDPVAIAERLGIRVFYDRLPDSVSGVIVKNPQSVPTILINSFDAPNRQRFTCAHELGHYIANQDKSEMYEYVDERGPSASSGKEPHEVFANQFAAELLMPCELVRSMRQAGHSAISLAIQFAVSEAALRFRLKNLKIND